MVQRKVWQRPRGMRGRMVSSKDPVAKRVYVHSMRVYSSDTLPPILRRKGQGKDGWEGREELACGK